MSKFIDLTGQKFNKLLVIDLADNNTSGKACWNCRCDCGQEKIVCASKLKNGNVKSCGCLKRGRKDCWTNKEVKFLKINYPSRGPQFCTDKLNRGFSAIRHKGRLLHLKSPSLAVIRNFKKQEKIIKELGNNKVLCKCKNHGIVIHYYRKKALPKCSLCEKQRLVDYYKTPRGKEVKRESTRRRNKNPVNNLASKLRTRISTALKGYQKNNYREIKGCFRNLDYSQLELYNYLENTKKLQNNKCPRCNISYDKCTMSIDHVIPLERANTEQEVIDLFCLQNLNLLCNPCNSSKNDSDYNTWMKSKGV